MANQESFDELLQIMIDYKILTYGIALKGEKGYEISDQFREWMLKCGRKAKSIGFKGTQLEFYISTLMTFNDKISLPLASQMANVIGGRNREAQKILDERNRKEGV